MTENGPHIDITRSTYNWGKVSTRVPSSNDETEVGSRHRESITSTVVGGVKEWEGPNVLSFYSLNESRGCVKRLL